MAITQLQQHFSTLKKPNTELPEALSLETICRFLSGMSVPLFTRAKVRKLSYFGVCQDMRYSDIKAQAMNCLA